MEKIYKADMLILDDFGPGSFDESPPLILLDILEDRHGRKLTLILSQLPVASWHGLIGDSCRCHIMERIVYGAYGIRLGRLVARKYIGSLDSKPAIWN